MTKLADIAAQARKHLGEPGPDNTCVSNGLERWTKELGLPGLDTASVSEARKLAKAGHNGWAYHEGTKGAVPGVFLDWAEFAHVSCLDDVDDAGNFKSIGSGGPTGKVAYQPASGGYNAPATFQGYFVPPAGAAAAPAAQPAPSKAKTYTVKRGDTLSGIAAAHHTTVLAIVKANPPAADRTTKDYSIVHAGMILAGQRIHLP